LLLIIVFVNVLICTNRVSLHETVHMLLAADCEPHGQVVNIGMVHKV